jgi:hypothetical protein
MIRELIGTIAILLVFVVVWRVYISVQRRKAQQQSQLQKPKPASGGIELGDVFYASTVFGDSQLNRVWAHGLGGRGKAKLFLDQVGISLERSGEPSFLIPKQDLLGMSRVSATIDKGVERNGLLALTWKLGETVLITNLRVVSPQQRNEMEREITNATGIQRG